MPPKHKPEYMCLKPSLVGARAEAELLRIQMLQRGCTCPGNNFQAISDGPLLTFGLHSTQGKFRKERKKKSKATSTLAPTQTKPRLLPDHKALFKGQNNQKLCLFFCHSLVSQLTSFFCTIDCIFIGLFIKYSFPQTFTVYQNIAISLLAVFFGELFTGLLLTIF